LSRPLRIAIVCVAGVVLLAVALRGVDLSRVRALVAGVRPGWVAAALAVYVSAYVLRALRWRLILKPVARVRVPESFFMLMAGYFVNYIVPVRAGEVAKAFFLKRLKGVDRKIVFLDSTVVRAHQHAAGASKKKAIRPSVAPAAD